MLKYTLALVVGVAVSLSVAAAAPKEAKPRTAKSIECSKLADAKGLHGKERRVFRSKCKKGDKS